MPEESAKDLYSSLKSEYDRVFQGWDFSYITQSGRMQEGLLSWNYPSIVLAALPRAKSLLDIGTGGGELLSMLHPLPAVAFATESYPPNVEVARRRLEPIGVRVVATQPGGRLPFEDDTFDLVIDRHEEYSAKEVFRVLRKGGTFITQQVGPRNNRSLRRSLGLPETLAPGWKLSSAVRELGDAGFAIEDHREELTATRFYDAAAVVYYLKAIPWEVPDYSIDRYFGALQRINRTILAKGFIETERDRCLIIACKAVKPRA
jgi:SAM-dependent methyltransferase